MFKLVLLLFVCFMFAGGCGHHLFPWNRGPALSSSSDFDNSVGRTMQTLSTPEEAPSRADVPSRRDADENFCEDMRTTVDRWRKYLEPGYDWSDWYVPPRNRERRLRYLRSFVNEYDDRCFVLMRIGPTGRMPAWCPGNGQQSLDPSCS
jgi:hypothetical protein